MYNHGLHNFFENEVWIESECQYPRTQKFCSFIQKIAGIPFVLLSKGFITLFRVIGLGLSCVCLVLSLGSSFGVREFFYRRFVFLAQDLAAWVLFPFLFFSWFFKTIFSFFVTENRKF